MSPTVARSDITRAACMMTATRRAGKTAHRE
ncbi:hypothetical protein QFZ82_001445 [Streptomyces sp. V4I23]|nr:hypothetical protein [Streptomyces sp. V4I23]